jgi:hypothetical protein
MHYTATEPTWWIAHGDGVSHGHLAPGAALTTGAAFFETFTDRQAFRRRLREIEADPEVARRSGAPTEPFARLAWLRWRHETAGLDLPGGQRIQTTRESQAQITAVVNSLQMGLISEPVTYKLDSGWADLSAVEVTAVARAVSGHVKASFRAERAVAAQLDAMDDPESADVGALFLAAYAAEVAG